MDLLRCRGQRCPVSVEPCAHLPRPHTGLPVWLELGAPAHSAGRAAQGNLYRRLHRCALRQTAVAGRAGYPGRGSHRVALCRTAVQGAGAGLECHRRAQRRRSAGRLGHGTLHRHSARGIHAVIRHAPSGRPRAASRGHGRHCPGVGGQTACLRVDCRARWPAAAARCTSAGAAHSAGTTRVQPERRLHCTNPHQWPRHSMPAATVSRHRGRSPGRHGHRYRALAAATLSRPVHAAGPTHQPCWCAPVCWRW